MHPWMVFTPEVNYQTITTGAGPGPMLAHAEGYATHAAVLDGSAATSTVSAAATYGTNWVGSGSLASAASQTDMNALTAELAAAATSRVAPITTAAECHPATVARMVTAEHAVANRMEEASDEAINPWVFGGLTPRIADLNLEYFGFMWSNNAAAGLSYGAVLRAAAATLMSSPSLPVMSGASPAAAASAASAVAEAAALGGMQAGGQAAMEMVSPAAAAPAAGMSAVMSSVSSAPAMASAPAQPMAAVQNAPSVPAQSLAPAQSSVGMFAPPPNAAVMTPPSVPNPAAAESPVAQMLTPRPAPVTPPMPSAAPGVTSFVPPAQPFAPPPAAGRATGLAPGMLNAAALRGPVSTMPLTTTATSTLATAAQPLAYVTPDPPRPIPSTSQPHPPLQDSGAIQTLNPPPAPTQPLPPAPPPPEPPSPPAAPQSGPPPSTGSGGYSGTGGPGAQMLGFGLGQAPLPLDPTTPTTTTSEAPLPECDLDEIAKLERKTKLWDKDWADFDTRLQKFNKKPTAYPDTPEGRQEFNDYKREEAALNAEKLRLLETLDEIKPDLINCGIKMIGKTGHDMVMQWPDGSTSDIPDWPTGTR